MAAGVAIVREAGGIVTDTLGNALDLMNGTVLASTPAIHKELLTALARV
jgi:myo-inositol-1(or 4)-monophosphatase